MIVAPLTAVAIAGASAVLWQNERTGSGFAFAVAALATLAALIGLATGDAERALILAALLSVGVVGLSKVKFHHSARALIVADAPLLLAGTVPFFFTQYRRMMIGVTCGGGVLMLAAAGAMSRMAGGHWPLSARLTALVTAGSACALAFWLNGGLHTFRQSVTKPSDFFSTFAASVFDVRSWWRTKSLNPPGMAISSLPLSVPLDGARAVAPHILLIQHESVFDPRTFGLPVSREVAAFLSPAGGVSGALDVEIFGGGSWQSEFSVVTGIPSGLFGTDAYFLFQRGVGRFKHTLPLELKRLGYKTSLISSCRRGFLNYDAFYGAIGMDRLVFSDDLPPPFDVAAFEDTFSDAQFLPAAMQSALDRMAVGGEPQFAYMLTNYNHGPHSRTLAGGATDFARASAAEALDDAEWVEYVARLTDTARAWALQRERLAARAFDRPLLVFHYGDHQPVLTRRIEAGLKLPARPERTFRTFYAVETFGMQVPSALPARIPIASIAPVLLQAAGLPLDAINATRLAQLSASSAERAQGEGRLLRTMVERGLVDLG